MTTTAQPMLIGLVSHAPECGKSSTADILRRFAYQRLPFATPVKELAVSFLTLLGVPEKEARRLIYIDKHETIPVIGRTGRHILQTLGTDWGRKLISPSVWVDAWKVDWQRHARNGYLVVADDVRFPEEANLITSLGGELWLIERDGVHPCTSHESEGNLINYPGFTRVIHNSGRRMDDLEAIVLRIVDQWQP